MFRALPLGSIHGEATDTSPPAPRAPSSDRAKSKTGTRHQEPATITAGARRPMFFRTHESSEAIQQRRADNRPGMTLLQQDGAAIGSGTQDCLALELDGQSFAAPGANRHQFAHHVGVGDLAALVLAAPD